MSELPIESEYNLITNSQYSRFNTTAKKLTVGCLLGAFLLILGACGDTTATVKPTEIPSPIPTVQATTTNPNPTGVAATTTPAVTIVTTSSTTTAPTTPTKTKAFDKVFIVILENTDYQAAISQAYLKELAGKGANLSNFYAITHPSYPNYLALTAGSTFGINSDGQTDLDKTNVVDLLEAAGISWKVYAEQYPDKPCYKGVISNGYVRKHLPMLSFVNIQNNPSRCAKVVPASQLAQDIATNNLPQYSLYIPDLNNDGHDTGESFASKWLKGFLPPLQDNSKFSAGTLVVVTFDEGLDGGTNQIYTVLSGEPVIPGSTNNTRYTHYDLLRTIEDNFKLGNLGREDAKASFIKGVWKDYP